MKTILILEDNTREMERLVKIVTKMELEITVKCACNLEQAYHMAMENTIDVFLLDIILEPRVSGDASGVKFADNIRGVERYRFTPIIFTTSLEDPNLYAYSDIHCYSYIEKPYDADRVSAVIAEALRMPLESQKAGNVYYKKRGFLHKLSKDQIIYIENNRSGRVVHTTSDERYMAYKPCKKILAELGADKFIQCNRFVIVNRDFIDTIDPVNRYITLKGCKEVLEIGVIYKKSFLRDVFNG